MSQENVEIVRSVFQPDDPSRFFELLDEEVEQDDKAVPLPEGGGVTRGKDALVRAWRRYWGTWDDSVEGYARAQSEREEVRQRRRRELAVLLLSQPPADDADVRAAAQAAGWGLPRTIAVVACPEDELGRAARRLPGDALACAIDGVGCVLVPDPEGPGRAKEIGAALAEIPAAIGATGERSDLARSWSLARAGLRALEAGAIEGTSPVRSTDHLPSLLLFDNPDVVGLIAARRLAPLDGLTPKARARMRATALAYIRERGNAAAMARAMGVHPQTARYRVARLRELLGDQLDDPDARFELELALRAARQRVTPRRGAR